MPLYDRQPRRVAVGDRRYSVSPACREKDPVTVLAEQVREAYFREYRDWVLRVRSTESHRGLSPEPRWDGGLHTDGKNYRPVWVQIADALIKAQCHSADLYIGAQFVGRSIPQPNQLLTAAAWTRYIENTHALESQIRYRYTGDADRFTFAVLETGYLYPQKQVRDVWLHVLRNWNYDLSPLFCAIVAEANNFPDVVEMFRELAIDQYKKLPVAYDTYWGSCVPEWVRATTQGVESTHD